MPVKKIYFVRHGYRANWLPEPHPEPPTGIDGDPPLAPHGIEQAEELAEYILKKLEPKPQMIYCSPFYRCLQTAEPTAQALNLPIYVERGIGEWYRPERDTIPEPADEKRLKEFFPLIDLSYKSVEIPSLKGEDEDAVLARSKRAMTKLLQRHRTDPKLADIETILLVVHAGTLLSCGLALLRAESMLDKPVGVTSATGAVGEIRTGTCSLAAFDLLADTDDGLGEWKMVMNGNTEYLSGGEEMHWQIESSVEAGSEADIRARKLQNSKAGDTEDEDEDEDGMHDVYVTIDIPKAEEFSRRVNLDQLEGSSKEPKRKWKNFSSSSTMAMTGIEQGTPYFRIDEGVFKGEWKQLIGTEVIFNEEGEVVGISRDRIGLAKSEEKEYEDEGNTGGVGVLKKARAIHARKEKEKEEKEKEKEEEETEETEETEEMEVETGSQEGPEKV